MSSVKEQLEDAPLAVKPEEARQLIPELHILSLLHNAEGRAVLRHTADVLEQCAQMLEKR